MIARLGLWGVLVGMVTTCAVACGETKSLGTGDEPIDGSGGSDGTGGSTASGGAENDSGGRPATGGVSPGGGGGALASGGAGGAGGTATGGMPPVCPAILCETPPVCAEGEEPEGDCCPSCVKPLRAACVVDGVRYEDGQQIVKGENVTCLCVDGEVGRCTGAILDPPCAEGTTPVSSCVECEVPMDEPTRCNAFATLCRPAQDCEEGGTEPCAQGLICKDHACLTAGDLCIAVETQ